MSFGLSIRLPVLLGAMLVSAGVFAQTPPPPESAAAPPAGTAAAPSLPAGLDEALEAAVSPGFVPAVGGWARYRYQDKSDAPPREVTVGVDRREPSRSASAVWVEINVQSRFEIPVVLRILYDPMDPSGPPVSRLIVKAAEHPAVELYPPGHDFVLRREREGRYAGLGVERVEVEAGVFKADRGRYNAPDGEIIDLWTAPGVAPLGLVKAMSPRFQLELVAWGSGYDAAADETPIPLRNLEEEKGKLRR